MKTVMLLLGLLTMPWLALASGYGVFTQGASALAQANAVVAHPAGPSALYFNPALLNDVPGRQVEFGATAIYASREVDLNSGGSEEADSDWQFPSNFYYTQNDGERFAAGLGIFFPFGLANEWDDDYEGRFIGTRAEMFSMNINPAISLKAHDRLSLAAGIDFIYIDADFRARVNQTTLGIGANPPFGFGELPDVEQKFTGNDWGYGFNLGALYKVTDHVSVGVAYRSKVDIDLKGDVDYRGDTPLLAGLFVDGGASSEVELPAQFVVGVATKVADNLTVEFGARWEDWTSTEALTVDLDNPFMGRSSLIMDRDWHSTWTYNVGANYRLSEIVALNCGYLYGQNPVPDATFEPVIPDADAHLLTIGADLAYGRWTVSGAFGYEYHETREKKNGAKVNDPIGSVVAGMPVGTADGDYDTGIYLVGLSIGYEF